MANPQWILAMRTAALLLMLSSAAVVGGCGGDEPEARPPAAPRPSADYARAPAAHVERPFAGAPVPAEWFGRWHATAAGDVDVHILPATSPECRGLTRGLTTCWTVSPAGASTKAYDIFAGGSLTTRAGKLVFRMTYNPNPDSPRCFADDPYAYRFERNPPRILILLDGVPSGHAPGEHCHYERAEAEAHPELRKLEAFEVLRKAE
jgi:hypothetical protein